MSGPSGELFAEASPLQYNSYQDVNVGQVVDDPLNQGVTQSFDVADPSAGSKEYNFRALGSQVSKLKEEREYWKGQAEAFSKQTIQQETQPQDAYASLDWDDSKDVRKAFDTLRDQNDSLRSEMKDAITALTTKAKRGNWDEMVTQHVPELTNKNPIFTEMIKNSSNPYEAAYLLAELNAKGAAPQSPTSYNGHRAMQNAQKPQSPASVGGHGQLSQADYYANMSDADFYKIASKNLENV